MPFASFRYLFSDPPIMVHISFAMQGVFPKHVELMLDTPHCIKIHVEGCFKLLNGNIC